MGGRGSSSARRSSGGRPARRGRGLGGRGGQRGGMQTQERWGRARGRGGSCRGREEEALLMDF